MQRFVKKIVELMREEKLFSWQGGPIIMLQVVGMVSVNLFYIDNLTCRYIIVSEIYMFYQPNAIYCLYKEETGIQLGQVVITEFLNS